MTSSYHTTIQTAMYLYINRSSDSHSQLNSNSSGNRQLLGQTNVGIVSDFLTVCLFSKGLVRDDLNKFVYRTTRTRNIWYLKPGPVQV